MGRYEGEVIQLLSNLGATLLGGEPWVVEGKGEEKLGPAGCATLFPSRLPLPATIERATIK